MDCPEVQELIDAYALGAVEPPEGAAIEAHIADCVRCWDELTRAQRTAALLALSVPTKEAPHHLEARIISRAQRERELRRAEPAGPGVRIPWAVTSGVLGAATAAALAFAVFLQFQMNGLKDENSDLKETLTSASRELESQSAVLAVATAGDTATVPLPRASAPAGTWGQYQWSRHAGKGFIVCYNFPDLPPGETYQAWWITDTGPVPAGTFQTQDGACHFPMELAAVDRPRGIGVTREREGGSEKPSGEFLVRGLFP
jgi:hypothetical protein